MDNKMDSNNSPLKSEIGSRFLHQSSAPKEEKKELDIFQQIEESKNQQLRFPFLSRILDSNTFNIVIMLITIFALFGDDIKVITCDKSADIYFDVVSLIALGVFSIEIIFGIMSKPDYLFSFFFWLDLISTASLILDVTLISNAIGLSRSSTTNTGQLARAGRASRIGTKAGRVVRLVRLIRIVKLYKAAQTQNKRVQQDKKNGIEQEKQSYDNLAESRVSKRLSDLTTKRVIVIVLLLLLIMPLFTADYYFDPPKTLDFSLTLLKDTAQSNFTRDQIMNTYTQVIEEHVSIESPLTYLDTPMAYLQTYQDNNFATLRDDDQDISSYTLNSTMYLQFHPNDTDQLDDSLVFVGVLNLRPLNVKKAILSICKTIFVCIVLTLGAMLFSKDANDLALRPIERMIEKVKQIAKNPITATEQNLVKESGKDQYETVLIENAIIKIGTLLALGFGDAGSEIIAQNMARSGDVDPMLPGKKKCAIYGFCDIRNFTDATEVLQEGLKMILIQQDVMIFVNNIAEIVHSMVDRFAGAANKNIGDAFLLVWKIPENKYLMESNGVINWTSPQFIEQLSDCSIIAFLKIICKINRESKILQYREDERLQNRMKGYKVKMGFGLHIGWGIEGAIGSEFKIDASYLSPNVNLAARLEAATKQYGVPLLISHNLEACCSAGMRTLTRKIDIVTVKGSRQPMGLFTIDVDTERLPCSKVVRDHDERERVKKLKEKKMKIRGQIDAGEFSGKDFMESNKDIKLIMKNFDSSFQDTWQLAFVSYVEGRWFEAKGIIEQILLLNPLDGPSKTLLGVISESSFQAPTDWPGYRELTEK